MRLCTARMSPNLEVSTGGQIGKDEIARATGLAQFEDHVVTLRADVDCARVRRGYYFLPLRQPGREWTKFAAHVP